ncbi:MAG TPA: hypothetical protein VEB21_07330, partial [Terriglobales bacterium]|nr:hypothetical protein [Terriglobales bacterium]
MKILIAGGGIGGLSAALALARDGHDISVAERAEIFAPIGAGIVLAPNATHVLSALAVDVSKHGRALPHMAVVDRDGAPLLQVEPERVAAEYGPIYALDRPALHDALLAAVAQKSDRITVRTNTALESLVIA